MKIEKSSNGGVIIKNADDAILHIIKATGVYLQFHPRSANAVVISNTPTPQDAYEGIQVIASNVTSINGEAFSGDRNALLLALDALFNVGGDSETEGAASGLPKPHILKISTSRISLGKSATIEIEGSFLTPTTTVTIVEQTIVSMAFVDSHKIIVEVTSGENEGLFDMKINNGKETVLVDQIEVKLSVWEDLRLNGKSLTHGNQAGRDVRYRSGMTLHRDANGMYFTGVNPWSSWVKFEFLQWQRDNGKTMQWIITGATSNMMIGIGSTATNEGSSSQYTQAEVVVYFPNSTYMYGFYGNTGSVGSTGNQSSLINDLSSSHVYKLKFENDGGKEAQFTLYRLPSAAKSDWDDENTVLGTVAIGGTLNPDEQNIMPFIVPQNGGAQRFIALKVE